MQNIFSRSPWERPSVIVLRQAGLGQNAPTCELTAEGGQRCADGTYLPPGCAPGSPETIQGKPLISNFPVVPVALAVAGIAAAGAILMSGERRLGAEYPEASMNQLTKIGNSILREREADAYNFSQYQSKSKEALNLIEQEKKAAQTVAEQNKIWETSHRNLEELQAAQAALDGITAQRGALKAEAEEFRQRVDRNSQNVLYLRQQAEPIIAGLEPEFQTEARRLIDPCASPTMKGPFMGNARRYPVVNG